MDALDSLLCCVLNQERSRDWCLSVHDKVLLMIIFPLPIMQIIKERKCVIMALQTSVM